MSADVLIANTLRIAQEDLDGAKVLASARNRNAVYLCEQAAEKVIRAVLTSEGKHAGIKHRLDEMVDQVPDDNPLKPALRAIEGLAAYATTYRYTTSSGRIPTTPTDKQDDFIRKVEVALKEATAHFGVDLSLKNTPAKRPGPIR